MIFYEEVFKGLNRHKVRYVVAGGIACVLYGVVRFTKDLDLIVELKEKNLDRFFEAIEKLGYKPKVPVKKDDFKDAKKRKAWKKQKGMLVFSFYHKKDFMKSIDIFTDEPIKFDILYKNKKIVKTKQTKIPVVSSRDLVRLKKMSGRPQDWGDINALKDIRRMKR